MFQAEDRHTPAAALPVPVVGFKLLRQINRTEVKRSGANGTPLTCITDSALCPRMHSPRLVLVLRTHTCQPLSGPGRFPGTYLPACLPSARVSPSRSLPVGAVRVLLVGRDLFSGQKMPLVLCSALLCGSPHPTQPLLAARRWLLKKNGSTSRALALGAAPLPSGWRGWSCALFMRRLHAAFGSTRFQVTIAAPAFNV
jgi:hypothetical protein